MTSQTQSVDIMWMDRALQGLAYWIGTYDAYFPGERVHEAALVAEFCKLLYAHRPGRGFVVEPEYAVSRLNDSEAKAAGPGRPSSVDIAVLDDSRRACYAFEVKRWDGTRRFEEDVVKLAVAMGQSSQRWSGFVLVCSQGKRPRGFGETALLDEMGRSTRETFSTRDSSASYRIRRVCRAVNSLGESAKGGQWVMLVEPVLVSKQNR